MEKIKEVWGWLVGLIGSDWAAAVVVLFVLSLFEPILAVVGGGLYVLYKLGKLDKIIAKVKAKVFGE